MVFRGKYTPETVRAGKTEGVVGGEGVVRDGRSRDGTGDGPKGGAVIVCCDAITRFKVNELRHILIAIKSVEEFVARAALGKERARGDGVGWTPNVTVSPDSQRTELF